MDFYEKEKEMKDGNDLQYTLQEIKTNDLHGFFFFLKLYFRKDRNPWSRNQERFISGRLGSDPLCSC